MAKEKRYWWVMPYRGRATWHTPGPRMKNTQAHVSLLKPDNNVKPPPFLLNTKWGYDVIIASIQAIREKNSISEIPRVSYRICSPREKTGIPYLEGTAYLQMMDTAINVEKPSNMKALVTSFKWFDNAGTDTAQIIHFTARHLGK